MSDAGKQEPGCQEPFLLLTALAVGALDFFLLGLAVVFGPTGFGGDGTMSAGKVALANAGQVAGAVGCLLAVTALVAFVTQRSGARRRRVLAVILGTQLVATLLVVAVG